MTLLRIFFRLTGILSLNIFLYIIYIYIYMVLKHHQQRFHNIVHCELCVVFLADTYIMRLVGELSYSLVSASCSNCCLQPYFVVPRLQQTLFALGQSSRRVLSALPSPNSTRWTASALKFRAGSSRRHDVYPRCYWYVIHMRLMCMHRGLCTCVGICQMPAAAFYSLQGGAIRKLLSKITCSTKSFLYWSSPST